MKERLCLEIERLGLSAVIMGTRGFGASRYPDDKDDGVLGGKDGEGKKGAKESEEGSLYHDASDKATGGRLGSVSDYCVRHCVCPVIVVRYPDDKDDGIMGGNDGEGKKGAKECEEDSFYHDASDKATGNNHPNKLLAKNISTAQPNKNIRLRDKKVDGVQQIRGVETGNGLTILD
ncbi:hypothetical protein T459_31644 [Capsicum annuum]|uniref:Uncharacterized protein n=1 Tax=Capsicum annuum TaxID=4072 RepID=A0A2G2Y441_CAPAN|nr:hypothetical protein T459_31644 [Capsicum annuum]